ncbi:MAG: RNA polymerase sigma factor [Pirellulales bacterium]|nr:RNA polymerase sigma factor [Pirellulales bacterium]
MPPDECYERLIRPCQSQLASAAWRIVRSRQDAADVLQESIRRIWTHRQTLVQHPCPRAWMLRIVINTAYEFLRSQSRQLGVDDESTLDQAVAVSNPVDQQLTLIDTRQRLAAALKHLSDQQAEAVLLRLVEGLSYEEVAAALGCSAATARVHVARGREKLRCRLGDLDPANGGNP